MEERWLSVDDVGAYLGVKRDSVYRWIDRIGLPAHRVGRLWKFRKQEIDDWVARGSSSRRFSDVSPPPPQAEVPTAASAVDAGALSSDSKLAAIVRRLVEAYAPETIYLFGSRARGEGRADSDYDLLVVVPDDARPERRRSRLAYERLWGTGSAADVLVWTRAAFRARLHVPSSLPATVLREGKVLYVA